MLLEEAIAEAAVFQTASPASRARLTDCGSLRAYDRGAHLFFDKDEVSSIYLVASGKAALYKLNERQDKKVVFIYGAGHLLNEVMLQPLPASINCEILESSRVASFPVADFLQIMEADFALTRAVLESMARKIRRLYRQLQNTPAALRGDKKLASKLWKLARDHGLEHDLGVEIDLDLPVTYLAALMGSTREHASRQLGRLLELGLVVSRHKRIIVTNPENLLRFFRERD